MEEGTRHCAFCLVPIAAKDVKSCGKCGRRVYCGQECQKKDWKSKKTSGSTYAVLLAMADSLPGGEGQGHKDWCGLLTCEEDLDWVVKDGGKGVVAKRLILKGERILVGNAAQIEERSASDPGIVLNHSCNPNSSFNKGMDYQVSIIVAEKDIEPGTEITYNYVGFGNDFIPTIEFLDDGSVMPINSFEDCRKVLKSKYGITCKEDCACYNVEMEQLIIKRVQLTKDLVQLNGFGARATTLLNSVNLDKVQLLQNVILDFDTIRGHRVMKAQMIWMMLYLLGKPENWKYAYLIPNYEEEADDIFQSVFHPNSAFGKVSGWMNFVGLGV